jgi:hypothetical protein
MAIVSLVLMIKRTLAISAPILGGFDAIKYVANGNVDEMYIALHIDNVKQSMN